MLGWELGFYPKGCAPLRTRWTTVFSLLFWKLAAFPSLGLLVLGYCFAALMFGNCLLMIYLFVWSVKFVCVFCRGSAPLSCVLIGFRPLFGVLSSSFRLRSLIG